MVVAAAVVVMAVSMAVAVVASRMVVSLVTVRAMLMRLMIVRGVIVVVVRLGHAPMSHRGRAGSMRRSPDQGFRPACDRRETG